jgi:hypothetical protein
MRPNVEAGKTTELEHDTAVIQVKKKGDGMSAR